MKKGPNTQRYFNRIESFIHIKGINRDRENFYFVVAVLERKLLYNIADIWIIGKNRHSNSEVIGRSFYSNTPSQIAR